MWVLIGSISLFILFLIYEDKREKNLLETVTTRKRGTGTERELVLKFLKYGIPAQTIFHDLYVKKQDGRYSQVDMVVATKAGIIVIEVKKYSGWIFGNGQKSQWTQVLAYGKRKYRLYNPVMQNRNHIVDLKKQLGQSERVPFYSVIVFYGNCELKNIDSIPNDTYLVKSKRVIEVLEMIMNNNEPAPFIDKPKILRVLNEAVKNGEDERIITTHIRNIYDMLGRDRIFD